MKLRRILAKVFRRSPFSGRAIDRIDYALPHAQVYKKFYNQDEFFHDVDWQDWNAVVDGFETRFEKWYFQHMAGGHASYLDLCALCALVEVFSYYGFDKEWHEPRHYKEFLRKLDPVFRRRLGTEILITRLEGDRWKPGKLKDFADVFYTGVRCSLHHHGDLASFAGMSGTGEVAVERPSAGRSLCGTHSYSIVVFDPGELKIRLREWLRTYCMELKGSPSGEAANRFRTKFQRDFGIAIP